MFVSHRIAAQVNGLQTLARRIAEARQLPPAVTT